MKKKLIIALILTELVLFDTFSAGINANPSNNTGSLPRTPGIGCGVYMNTFAAKPSFLAISPREDAFAIVSATTSFKKNQTGWALNFRTAGILTSGSPYPRVITPDGDGVNDRVFFFFETTDAPADGRIYDLNSAFVASMKPGPVQDASFVWDGKDSSGHVVPMGVYLYKVAIGKESVTGTIVVAR